MISVYKIESSYVTVRKHRGAPALGAPWFLRVCCICSQYTKSTESDTHYSVVRIYIDSGDWFLQPFNKTVDEGLGVIFNCVRTSNSTGQPEMATWVVNGFRYYWTDFRSLHGFIFISHNNSLVLYNISRRLDGYTFQCIIDRQASQIAYLTVWYPLSTTTAVLNQSKSLNGKKEIIHWTRCMQLYYFCGRLLP